MPAPRSFRPSLESLESRELPSATPLDVAPKPLMSHALRVRVNHALPEAPPFSSNRNTFETTPTRFRFDRHGIVQTFTGATQQWEANPLNIARYTIALYTAYRNGDSSVLLQMRNHARWLMSHIETRRDVHGRRFWVIPYDFAIPDFNAPSQFTSCLSAGSASCALYLAGLAQKRADWQRMSYHLLYAFNIPVSQGGLHAAVGRPSSRAAWYEEVAHPRATVAHILNGHLYATSWLGWYSKTANLSAHARAWTRSLFQEGVNGTRLLLPHFDDSQTKMSVYDLLNRSRFQNYHDAHVILLDYYFRITGVAEFRAYANRWRGRDYPG